MAVTLVNIRHFCPNSRLHGSERRLQAVEQDPGGLFPQDDIRDGEVDTLESPSACEDGNWLFCQVPNVRIGMQYAGMRPISVNCFSNDADSANGRGKN